MASGVDSSCRGKVPGRHDSVVHSPQEDVMREKQFRTLFHGLLLASLPATAALVGTGCGSSGDVANTDHTWGNGTGGSSGTGGSTGSGGSGTGGSTTTDGGTGGAGTGGTGGEGTGGATDDAGIEAA